MKSLAKHFKAVTSMLLFLCLQLVVLAQDTTSSSTTTTSKTRVEITESENWLASPWVWVIGGAVFILLLVALLGGKSRDKAGRTDKVTVTKTVRTDTDTD